MSSVRDNIIQIIKYNSWLASTPKFSAPELHPQGVFFNNKGTQVEHAIPGTARPHSGLKALKY